MTKKTTLMSLIAVGLMAAVPSAYAATSMMKACKKELKQYSCNAKTEAAVHECLEQHEAQGKKNEGFSHGCYEAHEVYEKTQGKSEANEKEHNG